jgi:hypothetical protein
MRTLLLLTLIVAFNPITAQAETLKFPSDAPIATVTLPDAWEPKETATGVVATSPDGAIFFSIDVATDTDMNDVIKDAVQFLADNNVKIDGSTQRDSGDIQVNGMTFGSIEFDGTDADGPVEVSLGFASPKPGRMLVVTYWGSKAMQDAHTKELGGILKSLAPSK